MSRKAKHLVCALAAAALIGVAASASSATTPPQPHLAAVDGEDGTPRSGQTATQVYVQRHFAAPGSPYKRITATTNVVQTSTTVGYFYADSFYFAGNPNMSGYVGLQTQLFRPGVGYEGKGVIMSVFGGVSAVLSVAGSYAVHSTEVGMDFWSIHVPYNWVTGRTYRFDIANSYVGGRFVNQIRPLMTDTVTGVQTLLGTIYVPDGSGGLVQDPIQWTELYHPTSWNACTDIPVSRADFTMPTMTDVSAVDHTESAPATPYFQTGTTCTNSGYVNLGGGGYREVVGATS